MNPALLAIASACSVARLSDPLPDVHRGNAVLRFERVVSPLALDVVPTDIAAPDDGSDRLFVATLTGTVLVVQPDGTFSTLLDATNTSTLIRFGAHGMTALACHPGFADPQSPGHRRLYVIITETPGAGSSDFGTGNSHTDVLYEYRIDEDDPNAADPTTRREILRVRQNLIDHNMSDLAFGPDGMLYIPIGDGGNSTPTSFRAQDPEDIKGSVIRIDPLGLTGSPGANGQYSIPDDNPYVGKAGLDEIYAIGLRSPYRITFDRDTGDLYVADVGQINIEELSLVTKGANLGWNLKEGSFLYDTSTQGVSTDPSPDPTLTEPLAQYDHDDGRSIMCGFVYRGSAVPSLEGVMLLGEFQGPGFGSDSRGRLLLYDASKQSLEFASVEHVEVPRFIYTIGEDANGELYVGGSDQTRSYNTILRLVEVSRPCANTLDLNDDGVVDIDDLYEWEQDPTDLDGDNDADEQDGACLENFLRRNEPES